MPDPAAPVAAGALHPQPFAANRARLQIDRLNQILPSATLGQTASGSEMIEARIAALRQRLARGLEECRAQRVTIFKRRRLPPRMWWS